MWVTVVLRRILFVQSSLPSRDSQPAACPHDSVASCPWTIGGLPLPGPAAGKCEPSATQSARAARTCMSGRINAYDPCRNRRGVWPRRRAGCSGGSRRPGAGLCGSSGRSEGLSCRMEARWRGGRACHADGQVAGPRSGLGEGAGARHGQCAAPACPVRASSGVVRASAGVVRARCGAVQARKICI